MAEYIERDAALSICETEYKDRLRMGDYCGDTVAWNIGGSIKALPAADVAPMVHGRWNQEEDEDEVDYDHYEWACSVCHEGVCYIDPTPHKFLPKYCPNCGAKMDGGDSG